MASPRRSRPARTIKPTEKAIAAPAKQKRIRRTKLEKQRDDELKELEKAAEAKAKAGALSRLARLEARIENSDENALRSLPRHWNGTF